jgi:hypothetical protein
VQIAPGPNFTWSYLMPGKIRFLVAAPLAGAVALAACAVDSPRETPEERGVASSAALSSSRGLPRGFALPPGKRVIKAQPAESSAPVQKLIYFGGRIISNVKIYEVNWGSTVSTTLTSGLPGFYTAITNSVYFDWLSEYETTGVRGQDGSLGSSQRLGRGTFGGATTITPSTSATSITDIDIEKELAAQIAAGHLPKPDVDSAGDVNALYMFDFPKGTTISVYNASKTLVSCADYGAYHSTMRIGNLSVPYGVHPDCGDSFQGATSVHSHEMAEAITDMEIGLVDPDFFPGETRPCAWYSFIGGQDLGEIADLCEGGPSVVVAGYTVATLWSNSQGACIGTSSTIICDGSTPPVPGCRACTAADDGVACNGARSHCETDAANVKHGQCVPCTASAQCPAATPTCNKSTDSTDDTCLDTAACTSNTQCGGTTPFCDATTHKCRGCVDSDCSGATAACEKFSANVNYGKCVECTEANAAACKGTTPMCDDFTNVCVGCVFDDDCPHGETCNHTTHQCSGSGKDGGADAEADATSDAALEAGHDAEADAAQDAAGDAEHDAESDATTDAGHDAEADAGHDAAVHDAATDAETDGGSDAAADAGNDAAAADAGNDAAAADAGNDAATADASIEPDSGSDGGTPPHDGGVAPDSGTTHDSGTADAAVDAGTLPGGSDSGCSCTTAGSRESSSLGGLAFGLLALVALGRSRLTALRRLRSIGRDARRD